MWFMGIDVGANGGIAVITSDKTVTYAMKMPQEDAALLGALRWPTIHMDPLTPYRVVLEAVHASPQMGVTSSCTFCGHYRAVRMALVASGLAFEEVTPLRWQRRLGCLSGGSKNVTKDFAIQTFPGIKITHAIADALLLAEYGRRTVS